jgi:hypothetical protein
MLEFDSHWLRGPGPFFDRILFDFLAEEADLLQALLFEAELRPMSICNGSFGPVVPLRQLFGEMIERGWQGAMFTSIAYPFPVTPEDLEALVDAFASFFPIYTSFVQLALGEKPTLVAQVGKLNAYLRQRVSSTNEEIEKALAIPGQPISVAEAETSAQVRIPVLPALRWRVFQRDQWRRASCGRSAADDVILHVNHIIPRSRGGSDEIDNLQTLCSPCNLGKSNRDSTDLRRALNPRRTSG